jgi:hypothetical protein
VSMYSEGDYQTSEIGPVGATWPSRAPLPPSRAIVKALREEQPVGVVETGPPENAGTQRKTGRQCFSGSA